MRGHYVKQYIINNGSKSFNVVRSFCTSANEARKRIFSASSLYRNGLQGYLGKTYLSDLLLYKLKALVNTLQPGSQVEVGSSYENFSCYDQQDLQNLLKSMGIPACTEVSIFLSKLSHDLNINLLGLYVDTRECPDYYYLEAKRFNKAISTILLRLQDVFAIMLFPQYLNNVFNGKIPQAVLDRLGADFIASAEFITRMYGSSKRYNTVLGHLSGEKLIKVIILKGLAREGLLYVAGERLFKKPLPKNEAHALIMVAQFVLEGELCFFYYDRITIIYKDTGIELTLSEFLTKYYKENVNLISRYRKSLLKLNESDFSKGNPYKNNNNLNELITEVVILPLVHISKYHYKSNMVLSKKHSGFIF